jgi:hypothetical protein
MFATKHVLRDILDHSILDKTSSAFTHLIYSRKYLDLIPIETRSVDFLISLDRYMG